MPEAFKTVHRGGVGEITEKKSRFIATVQPVESEEQAAAFIEEMKKKNWNASHNCSAFTVGTRQPITRSSDDGEPSGTAGKPILEVLMGEKLYNTAIVVTRYFGGTLLGTGGLIRAYTQAAKAGIEASEVITKEYGRKLSIRTDYTAAGKIQYLLGSLHITPLNSEYTDCVTTEVLVPAAELDKLKKQIVEATSGRADLQEGDCLYFAQTDSGLLLFEDIPD